MRRMTVLFLVLIAVGVLITMTSQPASAAEYPSVAGLEPFSAATNYMSLPGYLRWQTFREQNVWISYAEASRIVSEQ